MITDLLSMTTTAARKNKYRVFLPVTGDFSKEMDVLCHTSSLPGRTLTPVEVIVKGHKCQLAGETSLDGTWEATFYNTEGMNVRKYFINWMEEIHSNSLSASVDDGFSIDIVDDFMKAKARIEGVISDPIGTFFGNQATAVTYQKDIRVHQLGSNNQTTAGVTLVGAFPTSVGAIDLDDSAGEVSTTTVTFAYNDIIVEPKSSSDEGGIADLVVGSISKSISKGIRS